MCSRIIYPLLLVAVVLSSCATMSEEECQFTNWEALGQVDGTNGVGVGGYQRFVDACSRYGIQPDFDAYERGRAAGLARFCTPEGVYNAGLSRRGDMSACGFDPDLNQIHRVTSSYAEAVAIANSVRRDFENAGERRHYLRRRIRDIRRDLNKKDLSEEKEDELRDELDECYDELEDLDRRERDIELALRDAERGLAIATDSLRLMEVDYGLGGARY